MGVHLLALKMIDGEVLPATRSKERPKKTSTSALAREIRATGFMWIPR
jgi:hypothetical protein